MVAKVVELTEFVVDGSVIDSISVGAVEMEGEIEPLTVVSELESGSEC